MNNPLKAQIDQTWTLFLDRDGVINKRPVNDYVRAAEGFHFLSGVLEALSLLSNKFSKIIMVTNQQGVGKGLMQAQDLERIHAYMLQEIKHAGGRIDKIYCCTQLITEKDNCRKPGIKMAQQAKFDFPEIDFEKSIMVGDTETDMLFGKNAGMFTALISSSEQLPLADANYTSLLAFAKSITI